MNDEDIKIEERIIKRLDILKNAKLDKAVFNIKNVQDLLNLYNKEKEKNEDLRKNSVPVSKIKEKYEKNKAKTDCKYCNNTCDSYAICMFCKELLEEK